VSEYVRSRSQRQIIPHGSEELNLSLDAVTSDVYMIVNANARDCRYRLPHII
jgi:hypothetical protein